jgi:hypothetical protein
MSGRSVSMEIRGFFTLHWQLSMHKVVVHTLLLQQVVM